MNLINLIVNRLVAENHSYCQPDDKEKIAIIGQENSGKTTLVGGLAHHARMHGKKTGRLEDNIGDIFDSMVKDKEYHQRTGREDPVTASFTLDHDIRPLINISKDKIYHTSNVSMTDFNGDGQNELLKEASRYKLSRIRTIVEDVVPKYISEKTDDDLGVRGRFESEYDGSDLENHADILVDIVEENSGTFVDTFEFIDEDDGRLLVDTSEPPAIESIVGSPKYLDNDKKFLHLVFTIGCLGYMNQLSDNSDFAEYTIEEDLVSLNVSPNIVNYASQFIHSLFECDKIIFCVSLPRLRRHVDSDDNTTPLFITKETIQSQLLDGKKEKAIVLTGCDQIGYYRDQDGSTEFEPGNDWFRPHQPYVDDELIEQIKTSFSDYPELLDLLHTARDEEFSIFGISVHPDRSRDNGDTDWPEYIETVDDGHSIDTGGFDRLSKWIRK